MGQREVTTRAVAMAIFVALAIVAGSLTGGDDPCP